MTDYKLGKLYTAMRGYRRESENRLAMPHVRAKATRQLEQTIDVIAHGIDQRQAEILDWAQENGYPSWETVMKFAPVGAEDLP